MDYGPWAIKIGGVDYRVLLVAERAGVFPGHHFDQWGGAFLKLRINIRNGVVFRFVGIIETPEEYGSFARLHVARQKGDQAFAVYRPIGQRLPHEVGERR